MKERLKIRTTLLWLILLKGVVKYIRVDQFKISPHDYILINRSERACRLLVCIRANMVSREAKETKKVILCIVLFNLILLVS